MRIRRFWYNHGQLLDELDGFWKERHRNGQVYERKLQEGWYKFRQTDGMKKYVLGHLGNLSK